jgi:hypothetical protein
LSLPLQQQCIFINNCLHISSETIMFRYFGNFLSVFNVSTLLSISTVRVTVQTTRVSI